MQYKRHLLSLVVCASVSLGQPGWAQEVKRLPDPLTLSAALAIASEQHPSVMLAHSDALLAQSDRSLVQSREQLQLRFEGALARREFNAREEEFNQAYFVLQKQLYDFGKTQLALDASDEQILAQQLLEAQAKQQYRQGVVAAFYDVLIADLTARVENEQMAIEFVAFDNAKEEQAQGKQSALDMLTLEDTYQRTLVRKTQAEHQQRIARAQLAELLGYAQQLPSELETPEQTAMIQKVVEDPKVWQTQALANNLQLRASAKLLSSAELKLQAADKVDAPRIDVLGRTGWHSHVEERYDGRWRYDLALTLPIMDGGFKDAQVDKEKANLMRVRAQYEALTRQVRQAVLETTMRLSALKAQTDQVKVSGDFAEMYLDKSRTEYQYERKADLGDAMVRATRAELEWVKLARERAVLWEQLQGLLGVL